MRAFGWLSAISLALTACAAPPPVAPVEGGRPRRVASLNLCTDELLLLLADPGQIASLSRLAGDPAESPLAAQASAYPANDGSLAGVVAAQPDLVLTMGSAGDRLRIAEGLRIPITQLPFPASLDDVVAAIRTVAGALQRPARGEALVARIEALRREAVADPADAIWVGSGGTTIAPDGLGAQWLALAGYRQRALPGNQVRLEEMLARPPAFLIRSDYREGQYSRGAAWRDHPLARARGGGREIGTDGRLWLCAGPALIEEVRRLRAERRR